jgi:tetratricopeptide (TPR) repeat protein
MVYAYLQQGRDAAALDVIRRAGTDVGEQQGYSASISSYNNVAMPARYALERGAWADAAKLDVLPSPESGKSYPHAITHFARALGAARSGDATAARREIAELATIEQTLAGQGESYWAGVVKAQRLAASAWAARAEGDDAAAVALAAEAAALEDTFEKHPVTPGPILPARELEGDLLLELGRAADALRSYEAALAREPNRARSLYGVARAAELSGDAARARAHYERFSMLQATGDGVRPELRHARQFTGG